MLNLLKIGGSAITFKEESFSPRFDVIGRIASEIAQCWPLKLIIGNGGGSYPHYSAHKYELTKGIIREEQILGFSLTQDAAARLNRLLVSAILNFGIEVMSLQPSSFLFNENGKIKRVLSEPIKGLLRLNMLPSVYGDAVYDSKKGVSIVSTEMLLMKLSEILPGKKRMLIGSVVDGVLIDHTNPDSEIIPLITKDNFDEIKHVIGETNGFDVTGGMLHKIKSMMEISKNCIECIIFNVTKPNNLKNVLKGKKIKCTVIK